MLQHPNIVAVFDRGTIDGTYFIAMQFVEGRSMKELIDAGLTPQQASALVIEILEAAKFAHRHNIIHRDLKPQNVIVDSEGRARVTDFGIARAGVSEITQTGSVMGTAHYLSPEQAQGLEVTAASDLYSVGVILYEALTRRVPFEGESAVAVALKQVSQAPQRPSTLNPAVSPAMDAVVMRALEKDPSRRFHDADAFIAALSAAQRDPAAGEGTASFAPLPPVMVPPPDAGEEDREDEEAKRRRRRWLLIGIAALLGVLLGLILTRDTSTGVPGVNSEREGDAIRQLTNAGFKVDVIARVHRLGVPAHRVLEQDPLASPPADQAPLDCSFLTFFCSKPTVHLTVSAGPGQATVPDLRGLSRSEAKQRLENREFQPAFTNAASSSVPAGQVISTDPTAGIKVTAGSLVTVTVSSGPRLVAVPAVVGRSSDAAKQAIAGRGLELLGHLPARARSRPGRFSAQSPDAGTRVAVGDTVAIVVSQGVQKYSGAERDR